LSLSNLYGKNGFAEVSKNLARYDLENNSVENSIEKMVQII